MSKAQTEEHLHELEAVERARISRDRAATGGGEVGKESELKLVHDHLVAETVEPISGARTWTSTGRRPEVTGSARTGTF